MTDDPNATASPAPVREEALEPCPLCGAAFLIAQEPHDNHPVAGKFYIFHDYGPIGSAARSCVVDVSRHFDSREEAIALWNRRAPLPAVEPVLEEAAKVAHNYAAQNSHSVGSSVASDARLSAGLEIERRIRALRTSPPASPTELARK